MNFSSEFSHLSSAVENLAETVTSFVSGAKKGREYMKKTKKKILSIIQSDPSGEAPFEELDEPNPDVDIMNTIFQREEDITAALEKYPGISQQFAKKKQEMLNIRKQQAKLHLDLNNIMQQIGEQEKIGAIRPEQAKNLRESCKEINSRLGTLSRLVGSEVTQRARSQELNTILERMNANTPERKGEETLNINPPPPPTFKFE